MNRQKLENNAIIFALTIKKLCCPTFIIVGLDITFMYSITILKNSGQTNIFFKAIFTVNQIDNTNTITMKDTTCMISSIGDTACEIIGTY